MTWEVITGDCLAVMPTMEANSVDTIITDPPYGLSFMGKDWDHGVPGVAFWVEALRVAKPGALLLAFGGSRTFHRLAVAIEDAGWEIRDTILWLYGSGFPKSHDISKAIDKAAGVERETFASRIRLGDKRAYGDKPHNGAIATNGMNGSDNITAPATAAAQEWSGWGTALKPAFEPIIVAMKPLDGTFAENAQRWGVAGMWIDGGRVGLNNNDKRGEGGRNHKPQASTAIFGGAVGSEMLPPSVGRWPANVIHDGSDEVLAGFPVTTSGNGIKKKATGSAPGIFNINKIEGEYCFGDTGSAARFFYTAKASRAERNAGLEGMEERRKKVAVIQTKGVKNDGEWEDGKQLSSAMPNHHPTVKPLALMRYLARLTKTPTGGVILDPFAGSGSTGCAAVLEGRDFIGIEISEEYTTIARARIENAAEQAQQLELTI